MGRKHQIALAPAFVLHSRPYRETSVLLDLFSQQHGRIALVARGARSPRSRRRAELQPFRPLLVSWVQRGELGTLTSVEGSGPAFELRGAALYSAFYLNELLVRLLARQDPHVVLFDCYADCLGKLGNDSSMQVALRLFEKRLLEELGYGLLLDQESPGGVPLQADRLYDYHIEAGPVRVEGLGEGGFVFSGASLLALARERFESAAQLDDARRLMRAVLRFYLGSKPLRSRELFRRP